MGARAAFKDDVWEACGVESEHLKRNNNIVAGLSAIMAKTRQDNSTAFSDPTKADQTDSFDMGSSVDTYGRVGRGSVAAATFYGRPRRSGSGSVGKSASIGRIE